MKVDRFKDSENNKTLDMYKVDGVVTLEIWDSGVLLTSIDFDDETMEDFVAATEEVWIRIGDF